MWSFLSCSTRRTDEKKEKLFFCMVRKKQQTRLVYINIRWCCFFLFSLYSSCFPLYFIYYNYSHLKRRTVFVSCLLLLLLLSLIDSLFFVLVLSFFFSASSPIFSFIYSNKMRKPFMISLFRFYCFIYLERKKSYIE